MEASRARAFRSEPAKAMASTMAAIMAKHAASVRMPPAMLTICWNHVGPTMRIL